MAMETWELIAHDVWGNEEDGYNVNAAYRTGRVIDVDSDIENKELEDLVSDTIGELVETDPHYCDCDQVVFFYLGTGKPACELQRRTNNGDTE